MIHENPFRQSQENWKNEVVEKTVYTRGAQYVDRNQPRARVMVPSREVSSLQLELAIITVDFIYTV